MPLFHARTRKHAMSVTDDHSKGAAELPTHLTIGIGTRVLYCTSMILTCLLLTWFVVRLLLHMRLISWYAVVAIPTGMLLADFLSGLIHWGADTWGSESMPVLGKRLLHPFRVHHVNPGDFLQRRFLDTNGDVAAFAVPLLLVALQMPLTTELWFAAAVFTASFSVVGVMTNQIHQWAHMRKAPRPVRWLQRLGVILSHEAHEQHHRPPYVANYCITTGWCNGLLQSIGFFSRLEQLVSFCTGVQPRFDEQVFSETVARGGIGHE